jgi:hypothetical protein
MIGGVEYHIPTRVGASSIAAAVSAIRQEWPCAVFENSQTGERYRESAAIPFRDVNEVFVYRDPAAADAWDREGAVPEVSNTMVHLIADEGMITMVVDAKDTSMESIRAAIESEVSGDCFEESDQ